MRDRYASLREGLVGAWIPSVSGSGLLLPDLSGRGNNGTLTNMGPEDWVSSQYGRALDFDGSNDYVAANDAAMWYANTMAVSIWVKGGSQNDKRIVALGRSTSTIPVYGIGTDLIYQEKLRLFVRNDANVFQARVSTTTVFDNTWNHVFLVDENGTCSLYINGTKDATNFSYTRSNTLTVDRFTIAALMRTSVGFHFSGQLDDIRIYNRALTEPEIKLLASRPGIGLRPQRRTMYYPPTGARRRRILTSMP